MDLMVEVNMRPGALNFLKEAPHVCSRHQIAFDFHHKISVEHEV